MEQQKIKVGFVSLGCPKNLIDTETMLYALNEEGFEIVADETLADVVIINTCAFIESSKQEAIDNILDIAWLKEHKDLKGIVVTGCLAERYKERVRKEMPEADAVLGIGAENELAEAVRKVYNGENYESYGDINAVPLSEPRVVTTGDYFAYIKIAEGCDNCCSYCVIPYIRGRFRSRQMSDIIEEAKSLADMGIKEVCLVAQDTTRYGEDIYGTPSLDSLIHEISEIDGIEWIRVLYCYPDRITDGLIEEIRTNDKVCKYIDMPIQHINDDILKRMNRRDTRESIEAVIKKLRERIPGIYLRTTVITGFPGETEKQFNELLQFVKETKFERLGAFEYSREEGTVAFDMPDQVHPKTKHRRMDLIMKEQQKIHKELNESLVGKELEVICEGYDHAAGTYFGRSRYDAPEIDGKVYFSAPKRIRDGAIVKVKINECLDYDLVGKVI